MKFNLKKYIYLLNGISSLILKKEQDKTKEKNIKLRNILIIVSILLVISVLLNIILYINYV
jgi:hypothetical protein